MSSPDLQTAVIACPNCGTRYQVPRTTLGSTGREVACAQCGKSWHAIAGAPPPPAIDPDAMFPDDEAALDAAFEAAAPPPPVNPDKERTLAEIRAAIAPKPRPQPVNAIEPAQLKKSKSDFDRRQKSISSQLPMARVRRTARLAALVALIAVLGLGFSLRTDLVRWFPSLAGLYASVGLPVNVIGLQFFETRTLMTVRDGKTVMRITAKIRSVSPRTVPVPPILVSLLDAGGGTIYEWNVAPQAREMDPGEVLEFATEVNTPPPGAVTVRLSFTDPHGPAAAPTKGS